MSKKNNLLLSTLAVAGVMTASNATANSCQGELFAMNSGRGELGIMFSLDEQNKTAKADSIAKFSSSAIAYDETTNRTYYVSSPIPLEYKVDTSYLNISEEQSSQLPILGEKFKYSRLAYLDHATGEHVSVGRTSSVIGLTYDPQTDSLIAVSYSKLLKIDKNTGSTTELADFSDVEGLSRADLVIKNGELFLITATSVYSVDQSNYQYTKLAEHNLVNVGGATLSQKGDIIISRSVINDHGDKNESKLYKLSPYTGKSCFVASLPVRINDLTTNTQNTTECYTQAPCLIENEGIAYYSEKVMDQLGAKWKSFDFADQYFTAPAIFTSAPTNNDPNGGALRLTNVSDNSYAVSFQKWQYIKDAHKDVESFDFLAMDEGRYTMNDGTIVEVGSFMLSGTREYKAVEFKDSFAKQPYLFLQVQTFNGSHTVYTRAANLTSTGFDAAFYEQESLNEGHFAERVSYLAILPGSGTSGTLETVAGYKEYSLHEANIDHSGGQIGNHFYMLQEEQSLDSEVLHSRERVVVMDIEEVSLAQTVTLIGHDTYSLRRK